MRTHFQCGGSVRCGIACALWLLFSPSGRVSLGLAKGALCNHRVDMGNDANVANALGVGVMGQLLAMKIPQGAWGVLKGHMTLADPEVAVRPCQSQESALCMATTTQRDEHFQAWTSRV